MLRATTAVPAAAWPMLCEISVAASFCSVTAVASVTVKLSMSPMMAAMAPTLSTACRVADCTSAICGRDFFGCLRGLGRKRLHFGSDHRKAAAGLAGPRRLDRGVERQQIGLTGNGADKADHLVDLLRRIRQHADGLVGGARHAGRALHDRGGVVDL